MTKVGVIGAGISGLVCAYELKQQGFDVEVLEKGTIGGRMSTKYKNGFFVDVGANYFPAGTKHIPQYCKKFNIPFKKIKKLDRFVLYSGELCKCSCLSPASLIHFPPLKLTTWLKCIKLLPRLIKSKGFYDLSLNPKELDGPSAGFVAKSISKRFNDYAADAPTTALFYYRSTQISQSVPLGVMKNSIPHYFTPPYHMGKMDRLPKELAKRVKVKKAQVTKITSTKKGIIVKTLKTNKTYDIVVLTGPNAKKLYVGSKRQNILLKNVKYSSTICLAFTVPISLVDFFSLIYVPYVENQKISIISNEGVKATHKGQVVLGVALHGDFSKKIMSKSNTELFKLIRDEMPKVAPFLKGKMNLVKNLLIQKWKAALPIYSPHQVSRVRKFWKNGQGDNNVYFCGDFMNGVVVEGSIITGKKVATMILKKSEQKQERM